MVMLFHHAQGLTEGVEAFADELRSAGHTRPDPGPLRRPHVPLVESGVAFAQEVGFGEIIGAGSAPRRASTGR